MPTNVTVEVFLTRPAKSFNIVAVAGQDDVVATAPNQTMTLVAGAGMTITTDESTDTITLESDSGANEFSFKTFTVPGQSNVVADNVADTMNFVAGSNMTITTDALTDTITFTSTGGGGGDVNGGTVI